MKQTLSILAVAVGMAFSGAAVAGGHVGAVAVGSNNVVSGSASFATASGTGSATSEAFNQGQSYSGVWVGGDVDSNKSVVNDINGPLSGFGIGTGTQTTTVERSGEVYVSGQTVTRNISGVTTTQSGDAFALGAAGGIASATAVGGGAFDTGSGDAPTGFVVGGSTNLTATGVLSVNNGSNLQNAGMDSKFGAAASANSEDVKTTEGGFILGFHVPTAITSDTSLNNVRTDTNASTESNGGFNGAPAIVNSGSAIGGTINNSTAGALAGASAGGEVLGILVK